MTQKKIIEIVCTGNNGRSPMGELMANNFLEEIRADAEYRAVSSGTLVDALKKGGFSIKAMKPFVDLALQRGDIFSLSEADLIRRGYDGEKQKVIGDLYKMAIERFVAEELEHRAEAMEKFGIRGELKKGKDQTVAAPDRIAVLPVDRGNYKRVIDIYTGTEYTPTIAVLSQLATGQLGVEVTNANAFGKSKEAYFEAIDMLNNDVPKAVERIIDSKSLVMYL